MKILIIGEKYRSDFERLNDKNDLLKHEVNFLSEHKYSLLHVKLYLYYDIIIAPYRFCLLHLSLFRRIYKSSTFLILATGAHESLNNLVKGSIVDRIESDGFLYLIYYSMLKNNSSHIAELETSVKNGRRKVHGSDFKKGFIQFSSYLNRDRHGYHPEWEKLDFNTGFSNAIEYYNKIKAIFMEQDNLMTIKPIFPLVKYSHNPNVFKCFMIMPFVKDLNLLYSDIIKPTVESMNVEIKKGDDFFTEGSIMADIWKRINLADFILADLTGRNPNVFYELGIAHTIGKPVILLSQTLDDVPFDIKHNRVITYGTSYNQIPELEASIRASITEVIKKVNESSGIEYKV